MYCGCSDVALSHPNSLVFYYSAIPVIIKNKCLEWLDQSLLGRICYMSGDNSLKDSNEEIGSILGRIPGGLFIVTWRENGVDKTMLTSWLMQAGFNPPAISIAVGNGRHFLSAVASGNFQFVVNVLSENQRRLLGRFGKPPVVEDEPFAGLDIKRASCGAGVLPGVVGWMECKARPVFLSFDTERCRGDHSIVVADIFSGEMNSAEAPVVHLRKSGLHY